MVKKRTTKKNQRAWVFVLVIVFLIVGFHQGWFAGLGTQSVIIGEEGATAYDPLLAGGAYTPELWSTLFNVQSCESGSVYPSWCHYDLTPLISSSPNTMTFVTGWGRPSFETGNLYLKKFKANYAIQSYKNYNGICGDDDGRPSKITVRGDGIGSSLVITSPTNWLCQQKTGVVEVRWDDYKLGHYQVLDNGEVKAEGTASNKDLHLLFAPDFEAYNHGSGYVKIMNPMVTSLFGCDPKDGEYLTSKYVTQNDATTMYNLPGFKRFCPNIPAVHFKDGLFSSSKDIYYSLADGDRVVTGDDEVYKLFYIANGTEIGATPQECSGAFSVTTGNCTNLTGFADLCTAPAVFQNGSCVVQTHNKVDIPVPELVVTNHSALWSSHGYYKVGLWDPNRHANLNITSGDNVMFQTRIPYIDQDRCPYTNDWQMYPRDNLPSSCFSIKANGHFFHEGDTYSYNDYFSATLQDLKLQFVRDSDGIDTIDWVATWKLNFQPGAVGFSVSQASNGYDVKTVNRLPFKASITTLATDTAYVTGQQVQTSDTQSLMDGGDSNHLFPSGSALGNHDVTLVGVLNTNVGNFFLGSAQTTYNVSDNSSVEVQPTTDDSSGSSSSTTFGGSDATSSDKISGLGGMDGETIVIILGVLLFLFVLMKLSRR